MPFDGIPSEIYPSNTVEQSITALRAARLLLDQPRNWVKGTYKQERTSWLFGPNYKRYCAVGALREVNASSYAHCVLLRAVPRHSGVTAQIIETYNDLPMTKHRDILHLFDVAIESLLVTSSA